MRYLASKPFSVIYITSFATPTEQGDSFVFMAQDGYSKFAFNPVTGKKFKDLEDMIQRLIKLNNNIREHYDPKIHAKHTTYVTNIPKPMVDIFKGIITEEDKVVHDQEATAKAFEDLFKEMDGFFDKN